MNEQGPDQRDFHNHAARQLLISRILISMARGDYPLQDAERIFDYSDHADRMRRLYDNGDRYQLSIGQKISCLESTGKLYALCGRYTQQNDTALELFRFVGDLPIDDREILPSYLLDFDAILTSFEPQTDESGPNQAVSEIDQQEPSFFTQLGFRSDT